MGLEGAVRLGFRKELEAEADPAARQALYERLVAAAYRNGKALNAATHFEIDDVIDPADTRARILAVLRAAPPPAARHGQEAALRGYLVAPTLGRMAHEVEKSDEEWRGRAEPGAVPGAAPGRYRAPWSGKYVHNHDDGTYRCAGCGAVLFDSGTKFESGSGWPSFYEPAVAEAVELIEDRSHGMAADRGALPAMRRPPRSRLR